MVCCKCTRVCENGKLCELRNDCEKCKQYHFSRKEVPACMLSEEDEKTGERSIEFFKRRRLTNS